MKYFFILIVLLIFIQIFPQQSQFENVSGRLSFDIRIPPPDTTKPIITLKLPQVMEGYPIYYKDTILVLEGAIIDESKNVSIYINDLLAGIFEPGPFRISTELNYGENKISLKAEDKKGNSILSNLNFFQDPNADMLGPVIQIDEPAIQDERGIKVIKRKQDYDTSFIIKGQVLDESGILGLWINDLKIDSINNSIFYHKINLNYLDSIRIVAADSYGNISQRVLYTKSIIPDSFDGLGTNPSFHALILAVEDYDDAMITDLDYPIDDAKSFMSVLLDYYTFDKQDVKLLKNPTRQEILKAFQEYRNNLTDRDNLIIFYAGHGHYDEEIEQGYWLPSDAQKSDETNWIASYTIRDFIKGIHTQHTLVISDACFAGAIFDTRNVIEQASKSVQEIYKYPSRKALTSGLLNQVPDKSVFIEYLIKRLKENDDKFLDAERLYMSIKDAVIQNGVSNQKPEYKSIKLTGDEGAGHFIFIKK